MLKEAIGTYEKQIHKALLKGLEESSGDTQDIKMFFYKSVESIRHEGSACKGCFMINTIQELGKGEEDIKAWILKFIMEIKTLFIGGSFKNQGQ